MKINLYLSPCTKCKSKWNDDFNIKPATLKLIEEKLGSTLEHIGTGDQSLNIIPAAQTLRELINKWDHLKLKCFCKAKTWSTRQNNKLQNGKRSSLTPIQTEV